MARSDSELQDMMRRAEMNIHTAGYDPHVATIAETLHWVLNDRQPSTLFELYLARPPEDRHREWVLIRGYDPPGEWPENGRLHP